MHIHLPFQKGNRTPHILPGEKVTGLFWKSLLSYAGVLLLPLLIFSFYYINSYSSLKERTRLNQRLVLENAAEQINMVFQDAVSLGSHLQLNKYVIALAGQKPTLNSSLPMDRYYLKEDLALLQVSNALIQQINLYFPDSDYIISASSTYRKDLLNYMEEKVNTLSAQDWETILKSLETDRLVCAGSASRNFIAVSQPLLSDSSGKTTAVLCVQIDKNSLIHTLQSRLQPDYPCAFALVSRESIQLQAYSDCAAADSGFSLGALPLADILSLMEDGSSDDVFLTDDRLCVDAYPLQISRTALLFVGEKSGFWAQMHQTLRIMLLSFLVCILFGLTVIMYLSRKHYEPVSRILRFIRDTGAEAEPAGNEYGLIMKTLMDSQDKIRQQQEILRNNYLQKLLSGEIGFSQLSGQTARQLSLDFDFSSCCVVLLSVTDEKEPDELPELTSFIIRNVYQELLSEQAMSPWFSVRKNRIAVLLTFPETPEAVSASQAPYRLETLTEKLLSFLSDTFALSVRAGISLIQDREHIPDAYLQADTALEYHRLFETGKICLYGTIPQKQTIGTIPLNTADYVINLVTQCSEGQIEEYFDTLEREMKKTGLSWQDVKSCYYFFYQVTARLQLYCQTRYGEAPPSLSALMQESYFSQPLPQALSQTRSAYLLSCREISEKRLNAVQWGWDICRFIENNYFDVNLNLNSVAAHFQLSPAYLSKRFREQYHKSVVDYLYEIRIENSLSLLSETDLKIADIAQMTGFADSNAFIRIFKKRKGITPGKYRGTDSFQ